MIGDLIDIITFLVAFCGIFYFNDPRSVGCAILVATFIWQQTQTKRPR